MAECYVKPPFYTRIWRINDLETLPSLAIIGHILVFFPFSRRIIDRAQLRCWVHAGLGKCADYLNEFSRHTTTLSSFTDTTISNFRSLWAHIFGWNITLESTSRLLGIRGYHQKLECGKGSIAQLSITLCTVEGHMYEPMGQMFLLRICWALSPNPVEINQWNQWHFIMFSF